VVGLSADLLFLPHQSLWNDEATQMSGLSLDPVEVTKWLAGRVDYDFGVPDDRMPPLSYWAGWAWSRIFGLGEGPMRWFGVACVALATGIVFMAANRAWGLKSGAAAALLLATSPNVIVQAVEIRAYPMLILASAGVFACLIEYATGPIESRRKWLAGMVACGIGAMYTHFFGLVPLGGALVAALVLARARGESIWPVVGAGGVAAIAALGLGPFVFASTTMSQGATGPTDGKLTGLIRLVYRQFSHPATSVSSVAVGVSALGFVVAILCGLAPKRRSGWASAALEVAMASGLSVVVLVHLAQSSFAATSPSYNVWILPALALLMASGLVANAHAVRVTALAGIIMTLAANTYATGQLAVRGDAFAHTPHRHIAALIRHYGPEKTAVIHDGDTAQAWHIYSPLRYEFGGKVRQFRYLPNDRDAPGVRVADYPPHKAEVEVDPTGLPFDDLIIVRSEQRGAKDVVSQVHRGVIPMGDGPVARALLASGGWERVEQETYLAFVGADIDVFRKVARP
jgi:hypothetical protein